MSLYNNQPPTVWMKSIRWHTYDGVPQPEGTFYLAHEEYVETLEKVLKFSVVDPNPPKKATRAPRGGHAPV